MSDMMTVNPSRDHKCAFCKHWYDPTNSCIQPKTLNTWMYDRSARKKCLKKGIETRSWASCRQYEGKI